MSTEGSSTQHGDASFGLANASLVARAQAFFGSDATPSLDSDRSNGQPTQPSPRSLSPGPEENGSTQLSPTQSSARRLENNGDDSILEHEERDQAVESAPFRVQSGIVVTAAGEQNSLMNMDDCHDASVLSQTQARSASSEPRFHDKDDSRVFREDVVPPSSSPGDQDMAARHRPRGRPPHDETSKTRHDIEPLRKLSLHGDRMGDARSTSPDLAVVQSPAEAVNEQRWNREIRELSEPVPSDARVGRSRGFDVTKSRSLADVERLGLPESLSDPVRPQRLISSVSQSRQEDRLDATQTSSKGSETFLESRDKQLARRSEQGLQLTDLLGDIRITRNNGLDISPLQRGPANLTSRSRRQSTAHAKESLDKPSDCAAHTIARQTATSDGKGTTEKTRHSRQRQPSASRSGSEPNPRSRLNTLPYYRRLGRTRDPSSRGPDEEATSPIPHPASVPSGSPSEHKAVLTENDATSLGKEIEAPAVRTGLLLEVDEQVETLPRSRRPSAKAKENEDRDFSNDSSSEPEIEGDDTYRPVQKVSRSKEPMIRSPLSSDAGSADELALGRKDVPEPRKRPGRHQESKTRPRKRRKLAGSATTGPTLETLGPGQSRVFARWSSDRAFYSGSVKGSAGKRLTIFFDDGTTDEVEWHQVRKCEIKAGDTVVDLSNRPFKDVTVTASSDKPLQPGDQVSVQRGTTAYVLTTSQIRIREKWISQMDDRKVSLGDIAVDTVWTDARKRQTDPMPEQPRPRAATPAARSNRQGSITSSPGRLNKKSTGVFHGLGFLITSPSQNEENRKRKAAKRIASHGGICANEIWDFYEKRPVEHLEAGYASVTLKDSPIMADLKGIFLVVIGTPTLTPKYLMALALGIPCLSANYVDEAITSGSAWNSFLLSAGPSLYLESECSQFVDPLWGTDSAILRQTLDNRTVARRPFWGKEIMVIKDNKMNDIIPYCIAAMGAETVIVPTAYEHGVTDISEVDAVVFTDNAVPDAMFNARKTATVEWVKQCLIMGMFQPPKIYSKREK